MTEDHSCCLCVAKLTDQLKKNKREIQKLSRDLKTAQRRIHRLKAQKQKILTGKKQSKIKKLIPSFFRQPYSG